MNQVRAESIQADDSSEYTTDSGTELSTEHSLFSWSEILATFMVLLAGLALTFFVFKLVTDTHDQKAQVSFEQTASDTVNGLSITLDRQINLLRSLQGLFQASEFVSRLEFNQYLDVIDVDEHFPGAAAISWNKVVAADDIAAFEASVRADTSLVAEGYKDFTVRPLVDNQPAVVVAYTEPMAGNESAFGFNIGSSPERLAAVERTRDTGLTVISAPITLAQDTGEQKGFLMMLPLYDSPNPADTAQRRQDFNGLVVGVFRVGDLVEASYKPDVTYFQVEDITDGDSADTAQVIYSSGIATDGENRLQTNRSINIGGRTWNLILEQSLDSQGLAERWIEMVVVSLGVLVSLLAASLFGALASSRQRALIQAKSLTVGLHQANDELSRSNADLSQFAHVASHDLQTPVRNVISAVELLEDHLGSDIDAETDEYLDFLRKSATRMRALVSELLDYARLGRDAISFKPFELNDLLDDVRESTRETFVAADAELRIGNLPRILGDEKQLHRVFENLFVNSTKYAHSSRKPKIVMEQRLVSVPHREADVKGTQGWVQLTVSDNGQGIEKQFWETVFIPFKRLHRHDDIAGTGLGLGICKQVIERHGGSIEIESSTEQGTTFLITLPERLKPERTT